MNKQGLIERLEKASNVKNWHYEDLSTELLDITYELRNVFEQLDEPSREECEVEEVSENEKKYEEHTAEFLASLCRLKDRSLKIERGGLEKAREVIDVIAKKVDLEDKGLWLYGLIDGKSRIADKMDEYFSRSGDKVQMKKRLDELENENNILRSLLGGATIKREKRDE